MNATTPWTAETVTAIAKCGFPHEACERIAWRHNQALERLVAALKEIKGCVCGDKSPFWTNDWHTTSTRMKIADVCDAALTGTAEKRKNEQSRTNRKPS